MNSIEKSNKIDYDFVFYIVLIIIFLISIYLFIKKLLKDYPIIRALVDNQNNYVTRVVPIENINNQIPQVIGILVQNLDNNLEVLEGKIIN